MASSLVWWFWLHPTSVISDHRPRSGVICKCSSSIIIWLPFTSVCWPPVHIPRTSEGGERYRNCSEGSRRFFFQRSFFFPPLLMSQLEMHYEDVVTGSRRRSVCSDKSSSMRVGNHWLLCPKDLVSVMFSLLIARPWTCCLTFWALSNSLQDEDNINASKGSWEVQGENRCQSVSPLPDEMLPVLSAATDWCFRWQYIQEGSWCHHLTSSRGEGNSANQQSRIPNLAPSLISCVSLTFISSFWIDDHPL